ncbi:unnamed protein product [Rhizophagus irregularis]|nr:unnamed protein product [Rhizophagus irregularis]
MFASHQMINDSGLRELERFLDKQDYLDIGPISTVNPPEPLIIPPDSSESMNQMEHKDQMDNKHFDGRELVHHYNRFIWLIVRYCAVRDHVVNSSLAKKISILYHDIIEILEG